MTTDKLPIPADCDDSITLNKLIVANPVAAATARYVNAVREYNYAGGNPDGPTDQVVDEALAAHDALLELLTAERAKSVTSCCGHPFSEHSGNGCIHGWIWSKDPGNYTEGCPCEMQGPAKLADVQKAGAQ